MGPHLCPCPSLYVLVQHLLDKRIRRDDGAPFRHALDGEFTLVADLAGDVGSPAEGAERVVAYEAESRCLSVVEADGADERLVVVVLRCCGRSRCDW